MRFKGKTIRRTGAQVVIIAVLLGLVVWLAYPGGSPSKSLSQSSAPASITKSKSLDSNTKGQSSLSAGASGAATSTDTNNSTKITITQSGSNSGSPVSSSTNPQAPTSLPEPQPVRYPCNSCIPGAGHMCPMMGGTETYAPQYVCACGYTGGATPDYIACRLE